MENFCEAPAVAITEVGGGGEGVRFRSEPPRAPRVVSQDSVQKRLEFQPKSTALQQELRL